MIFFLWQVVSSLPPLSLSNLWPIYFPLPLSPLLFTFRRIIFDFIKLIDCMTHGTVLMIFGGGNVRKFIKYLLYVCTFRRYLYVSLPYLQSLLSPSPPLPLSPCPPVPLSPSPLSSSPSSPPFSSSLLLITNCFFISFLFFRFGVEFTDELRQLEQAFVRGARGRGRRRGRRSFKFFSFDNFDTSITFTLHPSPLPSPPSPSLLSPSLSYLLCSPPPLSIYVL